MTLNDIERRNILILRLFHRIRSLCWPTSEWLKTYDVSIILSPSSSLSLLAKTNPTRGLSAIAIAALLVFVLGLSQFTRLTDGRTDRLGQADYS